MASSGGSGFEWRNRRRPGTQGRRLAGQAERWEPDRVCAGRQRERTGKDRQGRGGRRGEEHKRERRGGWSLRIRGRTVGFASSFPFFPLSGATSLFFSRRSTWRARATGYCCQLPVARCQSLPVAGATAGHDPAPPHVAGCSNCGAPPPKHPTCHHQWRPCLKLFELPSSSPAQLSLTPSICQANFPRFLFPELSLSGARSFNTAPLTRHNLSNTIGRLSPCSELPLFAHPSPAMGDFKLSAQLVGHESDVRPSISDPQSTTCSADLSLGASRRFPLA